jgi:hypothetical protein
MTARVLMLGGTAVRIAVGVGYLLVPSRMAAARLAPDTDHEPDARLFVRGFGGHQLVTGAVTLAAARAPRLSSPALNFNLLIDTLDMTSTALEVRARGRPDRTLIGSIALSGTAIAWGLALRALAPRNGSHGSKHS